MARKRGAPNARRALLKRAWESMKSQVTSSSRRGPYRLTREGVSRMDVEGILNPTSMTVAGGNLLVSGEGPMVVEMRPSGEVIGPMAGGGPISHQWMTKSRLSEPMAVADRHQCSCRIDNRGIDLERGSKSLYILTDEDNGQLLRIVCAQVITVQQGSRSHDSNRCVPACAGDRIRKFR